MRTSISSASQTCYHIAVKVYQVPTCTLVGDGEDTFMRFVASAKPSAQAYDARSAINHSNNVNVGVNAYGPIPICADTGGLGATRASPFGYEDTSPERRRRLCGKLELCILCHLFDLANAANPNLWTGGATGLLNARPF